MTFLSISLSSQKVSEEIVEKKKEKTTLGLLSRILLNNNLRVDIQCDEWKTRKHIERERERKGVEWKKWTDSFGRWIGESHCWDLSQTNIMTCYLPQRWVHSPLCAHRTTTTIDVYSSALERKRRDSSFNCVCWCILIGREMRKWIFSLDFLVFFCESFK